MRVTVDLLPTTLAFPLVTQRGVGGDGDIMSTHLAANVRYGKPSCMHAYMHADRMTILYSICTNMCVDDTQERSLSRPARKTCLPKNIGGRQDNSSFNNGNHCQLKKKSQ